MPKITRLVPMLFAFVLTVAVGISLAASAPGSKSSTTKTTTKATTKAKPAASKRAVEPVTKSSATKTNHVLASAEDLSGTITFVDSADKEVTLVSSDGVAYDFELTKATRVELSDKKIGLDELAGESHKQATVHFVPRSDGNLAKDIEIKSS
ncbi:MAG: hypothetical protein WCA16_17670 [Candidatus Sulfotelmatobacter sp.]